MNANTSKTWEKILRGFKIVSDIFQNTSIAIGLLKTSDIIIFNPQRTVFRI